MLTLLVLCDIAGLALLHNSYYTPFRRSSRAGLFLRKFLQYLALFLIKNSNDDALLTSLLFNPTCPIIELILY